MRLFDDIRRDDDDEGPADQAEPKFAYLNRSARPEVGRIRHVLEEWFSHYPAEERSDLRGRFRSNNDSHHRSAFFELFVHELLLQLECRIRVHPDISSDNAKRPDFGVKSPSGENFIVEAVLASQESDEDAAARARISEVEDAINRMDSPNFFVGMDMEGVPKTPPSARQIIAFLTERLESLDPDQIAEQFTSGGLEAVPHWIYEHDGWTIDFYPIPKKRESRGKPGIRTIGLQGYGFRKVDRREAVQNAILRKAGQYGNLEVPYVVAVDTMGEIGVHREDIMEALFGREQYKVSFGHLDQPEFTRVPDGVWRSFSGPRYTRVSAVLVVHELSPWNVPRASVCLYHNPWAAQSYKSELCRLPQAVPQPDYRMEWVDGMTLSEVLGLPLKWPEV